MKNKGRVQEVLQKKKKNGDPYWNIIIDDVEYYDSKGFFKDKIYKEVEFDYHFSDDGKLRFIHPVGSSTSSKISPEAQRKSFAVAYAKDLVVAIISATMTPESAKSFADTREVQWSRMAEYMRDESTKLIKITSEELLKLLE